jgi:hypothetical protein
MGVGHMARSNIDFDDFGDLRINEKEIIGVFKEIKKMHRFMNSLKKRIQINRKLIR